MKTSTREIYELWKGQTKLFNKENDVQEFEEEFWGAPCAGNVTEPTLTVYRPKGENTGVGVVILPGGGYNVEAVYAEGYNIAEVLVEQGITAAVLKYRLPNPKTSNQPHLVPLTDTRRALQLLRQLPEQYGLDRNKIGVLGFSAGSHLATVASLWKSNAKEENPDFSGLIYGTINLSYENLKWLEESLYYRKLTEEEIAHNTLLNLVTSETPPAFLIHAYDDDICKVEESTLYAQKLFENHVPVEMHLFPKGGHGFGLGRKEDGTDQWVGLFVNWVKSTIR